MNPYETQMLKHAILQTKLLSRIAGTNTDILRVELAKAGWSAKDIETMKIQTDNLTDQVNDLNEETKNILERL